jgi:hypothetical protein
MLYMSCAEHFITRAKAFMFVCLLFVAFRLHCPLCRHVERPSGVFVYSLCLSLYSVNVVESSHSNAEIKIPLRSIMHDAAASIET